MDIYLIFNALVPIAIVVAIVWGIIHFFRNRNEHGEQHRLSIEDIKKRTLGIAIALLIPLFLNLLLTSLFPAETSTEDTATLRLFLGVLFGLGTFVLGSMARRVPLVGTSISFGGFLFLLYIVGVHFPSFEAGAQLAVSLIGLLLTILFGYWVTISDQKNQRPMPTLVGIRAFGLGFLTFFFGNLVIALTNEVFNPDPGYSSYNYDAVRGAYETKTFVIVFAMSILFLAGGLLIRSVRAISGGMLATGILTVIISFFLSFSALGRAAAALTTGLALVVLIVLAYVKFSHQESQQSSVDQPKSS